MDVPLALLADYANVTQEGKLNIMGIFGRLIAPAFPTTHPEMCLVMRFEAGPAERGSTKKVEVKLLDADGRVKFNSSSQIPIPDEPTRLTTQIFNILRLQNLQFEKPGSYSFEILVNEETKSRVPLIVEQTVPA